MARYDDGMSKNSIFQRRIISKRNSTPIVPTFLTEHEQNTRRNVGMKLPPPPSLSCLPDRPSPSIYVSWWMPLPPLTPTTPHQTSSIDLDNKKELAFEFPSKSSSSCERHEEYSKAMGDGMSSMAPLKVSEIDQERRKHHRVSRTNSSPAAFNFLPPIPKGPICLVARPGLSDDQIAKKICESPSPRSRRENELLEKFVCSLGEPSEEENDCELNLSPTVAEINSFLDKVASGRSCKDHHKQIQCKGQESRSDVQESNRILPPLQGINQNQARC